MQRMDAAKPRASKIKKEKNAIATGNHRKKKDASKTVTLMSSAAAPIRRVAATAKVARVKRRKLERPEAARAPRRTQAATRRAGARRAAARQAGGRK